MNRLLTLLGTLAVGAGAMYYLDPEQGRRRRALVGDRVNSISHDARDYLGSRRKQATDRVRGLVARVRGRLVASEPPSDQQLNGQIRTRLGRTVSYPHAIHTETQQGHVILRGDILERELNLLMAEIWSMPGIIDIDNQLTLHSEPGNVPGLQGRPRRRSRIRMRYLARNGATILAVAGGIGAVIKAMRAESGSTQTGMLSLAIALLAYGVGDGAQRLVRRRRYIIAGRRGKQTRKAVTGSERAEEGTPALLTPPTSAWH